jgi:glycosyltransferase involved in cell wall biosynthesis
MKVCVNSQTPFIRFNLNYAELVEKYGLLDDPLDPRLLEEGVDYDFSPGGVTAMVYPLLKEMIKSGYVSNAVWVSLGVNYPPKVKMDNILVSHVEVEDRVLKSYTAYKETLWSRLHGLEENEFSVEGYRAYVRYNSLNAEKLLDFVGEIDLFDVQDFQLLLVGQLIGPSAPVILRWHVPFKPQSLEPNTHRFILKAMEGFDTVVVSTRRDLEGLIRSAYHGRAHQIYPFIDPSEWQRPGGSATKEFSDKIGLKPDEKLLVIVARMDRVKSQDVAIRALARLKNQVKLRIALIGNGSFSSSTRGGLKHGKAGNWRNQLVELAKGLGVENQVVFLGHGTKHDIEAAYELSTAVLLTSRIEGFGITVLEGWLYRKPVVVSKGAGVSELVVDGSNGYTFTEGDDEELAQKVLNVLDSNGERMGENGYESSKHCHLNVATEKVKQVYEEAVSLYSSKPEAHN